MATDASDEWHSYDAMEPIVHNADFTWWAKNFRTTKGIATASTSTSKLAMVALKGKRRMRSKTIDAHGNRHGE